MLQIVEAVRIEPSLYAPGDVVEDPPALKPFVPPVPVTPLFLDLPLLGGDEVPHAPHLAATAAPWPGSVAVYKSSLDSNYDLNGTLDARSVAGITQTPLNRADHGIWDRGPGVEVRINSGILQSAEVDAVLTGANLAAIGDGSPGNWELFQFTTAELVAPATYRLTGLLRGQQGSDGLMPDAWPDGSWFVLLDGGPQQIDIKANLRQVSQHFRVGPAKRGYDDTSYVHLEKAFDGNGLRPYAPTHVQTRTTNGDVDVSWIRRTRIDGDIWLGEVPLGEDAELYQVQVWQNGTLLRDAEVNTPNWTYSVADQTQDAAVGELEITVAQVSARYGPGLAARTQIAL